MYPNRSLEGNLCSTWGWKNSWGLTSQGHPSRERIHIPEKREVRKIIDSNKAAGWVGIWTSSQEGYPNPGWWLTKHFCIFTPKLGKMNPCWLLFFKGGLVQPPTRDVELFIFQVFVVEYFWGFESTWRDPQRRPVDGFSWVCPWWEGVKEEKMMDFPDPKILRFLVIQQSDPTWF